MKDPNRKPAFLANRPTTPSTAKSPVLPVSDATFEREVIASPIPVFVDFWAPWCGPCKMIAPVVEQLAKEYEGRIKFVKVNTEDNPGVPGSLGVRSIPTLILFQGNKVVDHRVGAVPADDLRRMFDKALGKEEPGLLSRLFGGKSEKAQA